MEVLPLVLSFLLLTSTFLASMSYAQPPPSGDWVVSGTEVVENQVINLNGNLTVAPSGNLTLRNVTLTLNPQYNGQHGILAEPGSSLTIYDTTISSATSSRLFFSVVNATFVLKNSSLFRVGYGSEWDTEGLKVNADNAYLEGVFINESWGVMLDSAHFSKIINCTLSYIDHSILSRHSDDPSNPSGNNLILNNTIMKSNGGIVLGGHDDVVANNTIVDAENHSIRINGGYDNLVVDNRIVLENTFDIWAAIVLQDWSINNTVSRNTITYNHTIDRRSPIAGIMLWYSSYNSIENNTIFGAQQGIFATYSYKNIIAYNKIDNVTYGDAGIRSMWTPSCDAIQLYHSSGNFIAGNQLSAVDSNAILLWEKSTDNVIQANSIDQSYDGIMLHYSSDNNTVVNNILNGIASWDVVVDESSGNLLCGNSFGVSLARALDNGRNSWNSSIEGNYWGGYEGIDKDGDGIGDVSYAVQPNGTDNLPLMMPPLVKPFPIPETGEMDPTLMGVRDVQRMVVSGNEIWKDITLSYVSVYVGSEASLSLVNVTLGLGPNQFLLAARGASLYIYNSTITSAVPLFGGYQIRAENPRELVVKDSIIEYGGQGYAGDWAAIVSGNWGIVQWANVTVENNLFRHDYTALGLFSPGDARVVNNTIEHSYCGLFTTMAAAFGNRISNVIYAGLYGYSGGSGGEGTIWWWSHFENNTISNSWGAGIILGTPPEGLPVKYNTITDSEEGIRISSGDWGGWTGFKTNNATVSGNTITGSISWALHVKVYETHIADILVSDNTIKDNGKGIYLEPRTHGVTIYHNNIINSPNSTDWGSNVWSCSGEGNYWSDYNGSDANNDGIGDTSYLISSDNVDRCPLMGTFSEFNVSLPYDKTENVTVISNSTVANLSLMIWLSSPYNGLQPGQPFIQFFATGENGSGGFCRLMMLRTVLNSSSYIVLVDSNPVNAAELSFSNSTHVYLYFTYSHSTREVIVTIPEFAPFFMLSLFMLATLLAVMVYKRRQAI